MEITPSVPTEIESSRIEELAFPDPFLLGARFSSEHVNGTFTPD
jgi:hypothetical protein